METKRKTNKSLISLRLIFSMLEYKREYFLVLISIPVSRKNQSKFFGIFFKTFREPSEKIITPSTNNIWERHMLPPKVIPVNRPIFLASKIALPSNAIMIRNKGGARGKPFLIHMLEWKKSYVAPLIRIGKDTWPSIP